MPSLPWHWPRLHRDRHKATESLGTLGLAVGLRAILDCEPLPKTPATAPSTLRINCKDGDGESQKAMGKVLHLKKSPLLCSGLSLQPLRIGEGAWGVSQVSCTGHRAHNIGTECGSTSPPPPGLQEPQIPRTCCCGGAEGMQAGAVTSGSGALEML